MADWHSCLGRTSPIAALGPSGVSFCTSEFDDVAGVSIVSDTVACMKPGPALALLVSLLADGSQQ
jgi:hypothetical protein